MSNSFNLFLRYFLILALLVNVPLSALHAGKHLIADTASVSGSHVHVHHAIHEHHADTAHAKHATFQSLALVASTHTDEPAEATDIHFCHACQLAAKLVAVIPSGTSIEQRIQVEVATTSISQSTYPSLALSTHYIRGPPAIL